MYSVSSLCQSYFRGNYYHSYTYDKEKDVYICPNDKNLGFFENSLKNGLKYRRYKCSNCLSCPFKEKCTTSKTGRTIQRWEYESILEDVHSFTLENEDIYRKRRNIVEHPFGYFKRAHKIARSFG